MRARLWLAAKREIAIAKFFLPNYDEPITGSRTRRLPRHKPVMAKSLQRAMDKLSRSRGAFLLRPSYANAIRTIAPRSKIASRLSRRWDRVSARSCPTNKRKRNAGRRISPSSAPYGRGSRSAERARLSAFHHGSRQRDFRRLRLSFRPGFLGRGKSARSLKARPNRGAETLRIFSGRYPPLPVPVQRSTSRAGHSAGRLMPEAARERLAKPPAGTALAPAARCASGPRP